MSLKLISQGAEAKIFLDKKNNTIIKDRIKKSYRISELDEKIRKQRTKNEIKLLIKANNIINTPRILDINNSSKKNSTDIGKYKFKLQFINGKKLSDNLDNLKIKEQKQICRQIGVDIAKLHDNNIIHGDLTTSNMILFDDKIFFIDFGLGFISHKYEDKAVDIHLFKQALEAKHFKNWKILFNEFLNEYKCSKDFEKILQQLEKVEKRGRYKH